MTGRDLITGGLGRDSMMGVGFFGRTIGFFLAIGFGSSFLIIGFCSTIIGSPTGRGSPRRLSRTAFSAYSFI